MVCAFGGFAAGLSGAVASPAEAASDTCRQGFVWRQARPSDHVCVFPKVRDEAARDNRLAWVRRAPGSTRCKVPYVWREAFDGDTVCVPVETRTRTKSENAVAGSRQVAAKLWITKYDTGPSTYKRVKLNGSNYNFGQVRVYMRYDGGRVWWSGTATAHAVSGYDGGAWGIETGRLVCDGQPNGYAQAQDVVSGVWSARVPMRVGCQLID